MERAKSRENRFGFSWADEVEREEEQEKQMQTNQLPIPIQRGMRVEKPDPFGAARAREIILEEKGVDWKKLDQDFDFGFDSSIRESRTKKKPLFIQNVPCEEPELGLVPPLKYPPKNINSLFQHNNIHRARKQHKPNPSNPKNNHNTLSNPNAVLINNQTKKKIAPGHVATEKTGSNFEPRSVKEGEPALRRVLVELNNSTSTKKTTCHKVPCSNSYFGILELLEPSSHEKSSSGKWIDDQGIARKRSAPAVSVPASEELGAGKQNQKRPTTATATAINKRNKEKRSKRRLN